jgi:hypothetical protein
MVDLRHTEPMAPTTAQPRYYYLMAERRRESHQCTNPASLGSARCRFIVK